MSIGTVEVEIHNLIDAFVAETYYNLLPEMQDAIADRIYGETIYGFHQALQRWPLEIS